MKGCIMFAHLVKGDVGIARLDLELVPKPVVDTQTGVPAERPYKVRQEAAVAARRVY